MTYYDSIAEGYDELHGEEQKRKLAILKQRLPKGISILDVGCGTGLSISLGNVTGLDPSEGLLKRAPFPVVCGRAEAIPFKDCSFDAVISVTALHHVADIPLALGEIARVGRDRFAFSLLKRASSRKTLQEEIQRRFVVEEEIDEGTDIILICRKEQDL